jgi:hypothetical protein
MLSRHPGVGFISGVDDKLSRLNLSGRWNSVLYRRMPARDPGLPPLRYSRGLFDHRRLRVAPSEGWNLLDRHVMACFSTACRDLVADDLTPHLEQRLKSFFEPRMAAQRCDVLLHRLTGWPRTGLLQAAFPDMRVIHVVRDGRAVANSWLQMGWWDGYRGPDKWYLGPLSDDDEKAWEESGRSFPVLAGLGWKLLLEAFDKAQAAFPAGQWLTVRYEDVLAQPQQYAAQMIDFLGLKSCPEFEAGIARHRPEIKRSTAYRTQLTSRDIAAMERVIAGPLSRWGYRLEMSEARPDYDHVLSESGA